MSRSLHILLVLGLTAGCALSLCQSELDCSLGGICNAAGVCECDRMWSGADCSKLTLLPANPALGGAALRANTSASWGGSIKWQAAHRRFVMHVSAFVDHCNLSSWQRNSQIAQAFAPTALGPYKIEGPPAMKPFSHNPTVVGPTANGTYLLLHIGGGHPGIHGDPMNCTAQTTQESSPLLEEIEQYCTPEMAFSSSLTGPWTTFEFAYKGTSCNNPSLWITNNGTAFLYCKVQTAQRPWRHMVVYVAPSWRGPYEFRAETNVYGEDAFVFQDKRGNFHMLLHSMHPSKVCTRAWSRNGVDWIPNGYAGEPNPAPRESFPHSISFTDGSQIALSRRERHQLLFDSDGRPVALSNGVESGNDRSWTSIQQIPH